MKSISLHSGLIKIIKQVPNLNLRAADKKKAIKIFNKKKNNNIFMALLSLYDTICLKKLIWKTKLKLICLYTGLRYSAVLAVFKKRPDNRWSHKVNTTASCEEAPLRSPVETSPRQAVRGKLGNRKPDKKIK